MNNSRIKILLIDDDAQILFALKAVFDYQGFKSIMVQNVKDGLIEFDKQLPDIVLIDYHMPNINGMDGVRLLRERSKTVPIIVFTIDESQSVADLFLEAGASDFAIKPIKAPDIISRINLHIRLLGKSDMITKNVLPEAYNAMKGVVESTLNLVISVLNQINNFTTVNEIAKLTGLAYPTTYRYLQHLVLAKRVEVKVSYGKIGRPKQEYRIIQSLQ